jgi:hypothetical protein
VVLCRLASFVEIYLSEHREREGEARRALPVEGATQAPVIEIIVIKSNE